MDLAHRKTLEARRALNSDIHLDFSNFQENPKKRRILDPKYSKHMNLIQMTLTKNSFIRTANNRTTKIMTRITRIFEI